MSPSPSQSHVTRKRIAVLIAIGLAIATHQALPCVHAPKPPPYELTDHDDGLGTWTIRVRSFSTFGSSNNQFCACGLSWLGDVITSVNSADVVFAGTTNTIGMVFSQDGTARNDFGSRGPGTWEGFLAQAVTISSDIPVDILFDVTIKAGGTRNTLIGGLQGGRVGTGEADSQGNLISHVQLWAPAGFCDDEEKVDPNSARRISFDDGTGESTWKVQDPSGPSDWFNVDFDSALSSRYIITLYADLAETLGLPGGVADLAIYLEDTSIPNAPDLRNGRLRGIGCPTVDPNDTAGTDTTFLLEGKGTLAPGDHHVAVHFRPSDSHTWLAADTNGVASGRSFFTASNYSSGALPFTVNWMLAAGEYETTAPGTLLINGSTSVSVDQLQGVCLTFFGAALNTPSILYFCIGGQPFLQLLPASFTMTDGLLAGPCPMTWQICTTFDCNTPTGTDLGFCCVWMDLTDLNPRGKPKIKLGTEAILTITPGGRSCGGAFACFGQLDDCVLDSTIWKVQNPAGPSDWFNVRHGATASSVPPVSQLTGVSISSWDFCGFGPCWAEVGIYPANTTLDASGCTPHVTNPIATVGGSSACVAPAAGDWGCPLTFYDTPDVTATSTTIYHSASKWASADSCLWLGSDTDGLDSPCGLPIPNNGCTSLFTTNSYTTAAVPFTAANWMMQIDWN